MVCGGPICLEDLLEVLIPPGAILLEVVICLGLEALEDFNIHLLCLPIVLGIAW